MTVRQIAFWHRSNCYKFLFLVAAPQENEQVEKEKDKEEKDEREMLPEPEFSQSSNILCTTKQLIVVEKKKKKRLCCRFGVVRFGVDILHLVSFPSIMQAAYQHESLSADKCVIIPT